MNAFRYPFLFMLCLAIAGCSSTQTPSAPGKVITDQTFGHYHRNLEPGLILITMTPEHHARLTGLKLVPMTGKLPQRYSDFLDRMQTRYGLKRVANWPLPAIEIFCVVFEIQDPGAREAVVAALAAEPGVETAQIVQTFDVHAEPYNDPYLSLQHGLHSIQAMNTHQWSTGKGVSVAVVDTGMDNTHPDLVFSKDATRNFVDADEAKFRSDMHGTAVGGVIAANADNDTGMVGIAPEATLLALKACWHIARNESQARCNSLTLAKALNYAIQQEVDIINLSLSGPPDPVLERLVLEALARDIVVVGAIPGHEEKAFPVSIPGIIAVAMPGQQSQSITAPGRRVLSTLPNEQYDFFDGSSFSTAHISGLAALARSLSPTLTPSELLLLLKSTANPRTGEVNACRAIAAVRHLRGDTLDEGSCEPVAL